jgi:head-tail adaptor
MRVGRLRSTISIEVNTPARGTDGSESSSWAQFISRRASIEPIERGAEEGVSSGAVDSEQKYKIRVRYDSQTSTITLNDHRVVIGSKVLNIVAVMNPFEMNRELHLMCVERPGAQSA